jgi:uracil-DNA glycosylase
MQIEYFEDKPKLLASLAARAARKKQLNEPHIAPLTAFVQKLRYGMGAGYEIPYFDPWDGGIAAEVLFLFEAPGPQAKGSGFISRNNPDPSANNFFEFNRQIGICRKRTISWNIVPWYIGIDGGSRIRPATSDDIEAGILSLNSLLDLLPNLRCIALFGKKAQRGSNHIKKLRPHVRQFESPHPSLQVVNRDPANKTKILNALREIASFLDTSP